MSAPEKPIDTDLAEGGDFLSRWSRRKVEAREQEIIDPEPQDEIDESADELTAEQLDELSDEEILEELGLPDPETLKAGDDFKGFMKNTVPARIRNRALRKLWLSNPVLANVDMLVDYGEDFTDAATVIPNMKTAYEVGKGIARKYEELIQKKKEEDAIAEQEAQDAQEVQDVQAANELSEDVDDPSTGESHDEVVEVVDSELEQTAEPMFSSDLDGSIREFEEIEAMPVPRRMKFSV